MSRLDLICGIYLNSGVVSQHGRVAEGIREGELEVQQFVLVQVEGKPDLGVSLVHVVDGVHDAADDKRVGYLVVLQTDVPHILYFQRVGVELHDDLRVQFQ